MRAQKFMVEQLICHKALGSSPRYLPKLWGSRIDVTRLGSDPRGKIHQRHKLALRCVLLWAISFRGASLVVWATPWTGGDSAQAFLELLSGIAYRAAQQSEQLAGG